ncbi:sensor domain-containing diguanylate cyclase [Sulfurimonas paralvinellae]|uniref:EAL domain-containing protein n=1 Tax=Sulfurimonas paralvinellae TaxID=317658 RepID=A0A7M1BCN4_9BACT|nr:EAL domain-containing protein [Sulfurimonas paralvinellae]QOP46542.1 EAL domain-containing protein [Sulfurimonas paralvinellae]
MSKEENSNCALLEDLKMDEVSVTQEQYNHILNIQKVILEKVAERGSSSQILDELCLMAESLLPNSVASIMLKDKKTGLMDMIHAPSVPPEGIEKFKDLKPGPHGGSCGNAVYRNEPQYIKDTFTDSKWEDLREIAYDFNLCSCWSVPVRNEQKEAIGTFALSSFEHRSPSQFHKLLLETAANIVSIVLKNTFNERRIELFTQAMENAKEGVIITDRENNIIEVNKAFKDIYGYTDEEVLHHNPNMLASGHHDKSFYKKMWDDILHKTHWSGEIINRRKNGQEITQWMSVSLIKEEDETKNYLAIFSDITELKEAQQRANYLAYHDQLTGLDNKSKLTQLLTNNEKAYTLIHFDINNFSYINSAYGFAFADRLLQEIAKTLVNICELPDIFRVNSDEFAFLCEKDLAKDIIKKVQKYFYENSFEIDGVVLNISFNYGACHGVENLMENASLALKISKDLGKNRYHIFDPVTDLPRKEDKNRFVKANRLILDALESDRIVPYFQGIHNNETNEISKYEALVRIEMDDRVISPFEFLEAGQLSGLMPEITMRMIDKSFAVMQDRRESFSLNITEDDLGRNYLSGYISQKLKEYGIDPQRIILEILEGVSSHGKQSHLKQLNELKEMGLGLAIDDFGAEYSNFERILDLDIDFLKIDAKYIKNIDRDEKSYEIVKSIANFAQNSNITCIAEFVHSSEVQAVVEALGIEYSQGYYFSQPEKFS